jgi:hypothetical protein
MSKRQKGILFLVFFFAAVNLTRAQEAEPPAAAPDATVAIERPKVAYDAAGSRDPFISMISKETTMQGEQPERQLPAMSVQGIIWGGIFPQAIINNKVVKVGDIINEAKVVNIDKEGIRLLFEGRVYTLSSPAAAGQAPAAEARE